MKKIQLCVFLLSLVHFIKVNGQNVGGHGNSQISPSEVKASEMTKGAYTADVNLFTGALSSSYPLGSVSTPSGLSFTLSLNYSSSFSAGNDVPLVNGVPYGEGWSLNLPTISVSTQEYNKYSREDMASKNSDPNDPYDYPDYSYTEAGLEGKQYWYAPEINIPGVISERFVYKYTEDNGEGDMVFVPSKFDSYVEARLKDNYWRVIISDGTVYEFGIATVGVRNASNQRYMQGNLSPSTLPGSPNPAVYEPKEEYLSWQISKIYHPNYPNHQSIQFVYDRFGAFDYYKEFQQYRFIAATGVGYNFTAYKDVLLKEVVSAEDFGARFIESIVLNYRTQNYGSMPKMLLPWQDDVGRKDSLYNFKTVYAQGIESGEASRFADPGSTNTHFTNWLRYHHVRSHTVQLNYGLTNHLSMLGSNPYVSNASGSATDGGWDEDPTHNNEKLFRGVAGTTSGNNGDDDLVFDHSFLESPLLNALPDGDGNNDDLPAGDLYEIRTLISTSSSSKFANFDVNIVAGDMTTTSSESSITTSPVDAISEIDYNEYQRHRSEALFSTFNHPVKWNISKSGAYGGASTVLTSNLFSLSNMPRDFNGFRIQVGPANSDHDFGRYGADGEMISDNEDSGSSADFANSYRAYYNNLKTVGQPLQDAACSPIPPNFGVGLEWHMMRRIYSDMYDGTYNEDCSRYSSSSDGFWWKFEQTTLGGITWNNVPTAADNNVQLNAVELIRYSKNPYMLNYVRNYRCDGVDSVKGTSRVIMTSMLKMEYDVVTDSVKNNVDEFSAASTLSNYNLHQKKNIFLLKRIREIPVNSSKVNTPLVSLDTTAVPTTHYDYKKYRLYQTTDHFYIDSTASVINGNAFALSKITDRLGGVTDYEYYRYMEHQMVNNFYSWMSQAGRLISGSSYLSSDVGMGRQTAFSYNLCVKKKIVTDATSSSIPKEWLYSYEDMQVHVLAPESFPEGNFYVSSSKSERGFVKTIVKEPLIDSNPNRIRTEYIHYTDEYNGALFGKLKQSIAYDAGNHKVEKKEFKYKVREAYVNGLLRSQDYVTAEYDGSNPMIHYSDPDGDYDKVGLIDFGTPPFEGTSPIVTGEIKNMTGMEFTYPLLFDYHYLKSYFIPLVKEITTSYDNFLPSKVVALTNSVVSPVPVGSIKMMTGTIAGSSLLSPTLSAVTVSQDSIRNITEYEYWDTDSIGITDSHGYDILNGSLAGSDAQLIYEPSWELYRKKTYSPELPDAYSTEESFYYFDMKNYLNTTYRRDTIMNLYGLNWSSRYMMRNIPYEKRVTTKSQGLDPVSRSSYYWYDTRFVAPNETDEADYTAMYTSEPGNCMSDVPIRSYTGLAPDPSCIEGDSALDAYAPPGYLKTVDSTGAVWWCPQLLDDLTSETHQVRAPFFRRELKNNLFLRYTSVQVDELLTDNTDYTDLGDDRHILRFKTSGLLTPPVFPFRSHTDYYAEERNMYGQVKLEHDTKGLKTFYYYTPRVNVNFEDDALDPCPSHIITAFPNLGLPTAVTLGYSLEDSLRTVYMYNHDNSVNTLTDPNGMIMHYDYDEYGRLINTTRNGELLAINSYHNWENTFTQTFEERAEENYVETYTLNDIGSTVAERSRAYVDPQGRKYDVLTQVSPDYTDPSAYDTKMVHSGLTTFDNWNRTVAQYKPFKTGNGTSPETFVPDFNSSTDPKSEQRYENTQRSKVLRASKFGESIVSGHTVNSSYKLIPGRSLVQELGLNSTEQGLMLPGGANLYKFMKTSMVDEDGKKVITYSDAIGRQVATKTYIAFNKTAVTLFIYNSTGQQKLVINPLKQQSTYEYNLPGQLFRKTTVDGGETRYIYNASGQLVLEEDADARAGTGWSGPYMRRYHYDDFGRMVKQERVTFSGSDFQHPFYWQDYEDLTDTPSPDRLTFSSATTTDYEFNLQHYSSLLHAYTDVSPYAYLSSAAVEKEFTYHALVLTTDPVYTAAHTSVQTYLGTNAQEKLYGRMSTSTSYDNSGTPEEYKIYSYNAEGFPAYEITQFVKGSTVIPTVITYPAYNLRGSLQREIVDAGLNGTNDADYRYTYDGWNRMEHVYVNGDLSDNDGDLAQYFYDDALGLLTKTRYFNYLESFCAPAVDDINYAYDVRDRLTSISSRFFDENLYYDAGSNRHPQLADTAFKVLASENYNGNINAVKVNYKLSTAGNYEDTRYIMDDPTYYGYRYDGMNRLNYADASVMNALTGSPSTPTVKRHYGDEGYAYDKTGNITTLYRGYYYDPLISSPANAVDYWNYYYTSGTNKLNRVSDAVTSSALRNYAYDNSGNMLTDDFKDITATTYGRGNLPVDVTRTVGMSGRQYDYLYNANDSRIYKGYSDVNQEYYLQDGSGKTLGIYDIVQTNWSWYAYGKDRIAKFDGTKEFFEYDHLGNTRVSYSASSMCTGEYPHYVGSSTFTINNAIDYYPYGKILRSYMGSGRDKFLMTGHERDMETDLDYKGARFFDSDIARFESLDPLAGQFDSWSPYNYCFGNPAMYTDVTGKAPTDFEDKNGQKVKHVEDGSNAVFQQKGEGLEKHYEFKGWDEAQKGKNVVNLTSLLEEAQNLNASNASLEPDGNTYCNYATQNIFKAINSATTFNGGPNTQLPTSGMANGMSDNFETNPALTSIDAQPLLMTYYNISMAAQAGNMVVFGYNNPNGHGHVGTARVGTGFDYGVIANVGASNGNMQVTNYFDKNVTPKVFSKTLFPSVKFYKLSDAVQPKVGPPIIVPPID